MRRHWFAVCWGALLIFRVAPLGAHDFFVEPAHPTTADEVRLVAEIDCFSQQEIELFAAGDHSWRAVVQPSAVDSACLPVPSPLVSDSLGQLEPGFYTAVLLGPSPNGGAPLELGTATFEVRQADSPTLELRSGRFRVTASWRIPLGPPGSGHAVPLTLDSGAFWFFRPDNLELMIKVLNGCAVNGHFWVLGAGLTDVGVSLEILDTATGATWSHQSPAGTPFAAVQDTGAFDCP